MDAEINEGRLRMEVENLEILKQRIAALSE
jgi:hypothetical protein